MGAAYIAIGKDVTKPFMKSTILFYIAGLLVLPSCIKSEALNSEADILKCILPEGAMTEEAVDYYAAYDEKLRAYPIDIQVHSGTSLSSLALDFELTPGAVIEPAGGSVQNFNKRVRYTVTSEDGRWQRVYSIGIDYPSTNEIVTEFGFDYANKSKYYTFVDAAPGRTTVTWASGNQGFALTAGDAAAEEYPTSMSPDGRTGNCLKLTTKTTGALGEKVGKPIAAGNLYMGRFDILNAMGDALSATKMGTTFMHRPTKVSGYYKYTPGDRYYDNGYDNDKVDGCIIYAIFYEKTAELQYMTGHNAYDGWTHPNMVAYARAVTPAAKDWTRFEMEFDYDRYGKEIDKAKLAAGGYNIAIVMSSSSEGELFKGAPGSTLMVDDMVLEYE